MTQIFRKVTITNQWVGTCKISFFEWFRDHQNQSNAMELLPMLGSWEQPSFIEDDKISRVFVVIRLGIWRIG